MFEILEQGLLLVLRGQYVVPDNVRRPDSLSVWWCVGPPCYLACAAVLDLIPPVTRTRATYVNGDDGPLAGRASCFRCADLKGPRHACCKQTGKCACCFCCESDNKSACQVPKTCCLGWNQFCCCALCPSPCIPLDLSWLVSVGASRG